MILVRNVIDAHVQDVMVNHALLMTDLSTFAYWTCSLHAMRNA